MNFKKLFLKVFITPNLFSFSNIYHSILSKSLKKFWIPMKSTFTILESVYNSAIMHGRRPVGDWR